MNIDQQTIIAIGAVFAVLMLLCVIFSILSFVNCKKALNKRAPAYTAATPGSPKITDMGISGETIAVITAAIAAYSDKSSQRLVIRSIHR